MTINDNDKICMARGIAKELVYILHGCRESFPGAYDYFMGELDITDEMLDEAYNLFFGDEK